uniref:AB hydrolase-1 domain-containing protein n=1 Tax=Oryza meridionalis TaxID=40149 RepID=A0A0E0C045_9ORYZ
MAAAEVRHRTVEVASGVRLHVAEAGPEDGPAVLLVHGFPELWYSWRHQMRALAARGFRAVAPDLRGYGDSDAPPGRDSYTVLHLVGDLVALIADVGQPRVFVAAHDWGAAVAWQLCLLRPDLVTAFVALSVEYHPRNPTRSPVQTLRAVCGDGHYICFFQLGECLSVTLVRSGLPGMTTTSLSAAAFPQCFPSGAAAFHERLCSSLLKVQRECCRGFDTVVTLGAWSIWKEKNSRKPGVAEAEFGRGDIKCLLKKFYGMRKAAPLIIPPGKTLFDSIDSDGTCPAWLSEEDISYYAEKFEKTGFTGGLNYYRCIDLNWELTAPWTGVPIKVPTKFIVGDQDLTYNIPGVKDYIHKGGLKACVPNLEDVVVMEGVAHFINQEKPDEVSDHICGFFSKF